MDIKIAEIYVPAVLKFRISLKNSGVMLADLYIKALNDELARLRKAHAATDELINKSLGGYEAIIRNKAIAGYLVSVKELQKGSDVEATTDTSEELKDELNNLKGKLKKIIDDLRWQIDSVQTVKLSNVDIQYWELDARRNDFMKDLPEDKLKLTALLEKRDTVQQAIDEYESKTVIDKVMPAAEIVKEGVVAVIDEGGNLGKSGKADMRAEAGKQAIKAAANIAIEVLKSANESIKYEQLLQAKAYLNREVEIREEKMSIQEKELNDIDNRRAQLAAFRAFAGLRGDYVVEVNKIKDFLIEYFNSVFVNDMREVGEVVLVGESFSEHSPEFSTFLNRFQFSWSRMWDYGS
ncbi:hypothetical protein ACXR0M_03800 [Pseudomonas sp. Eth.TT006]